MGMDEVSLSEALIAIDTSDQPGIESAMEFIDGWCAGAGLPVEEIRFGARRCLRIGVGSGPRRIMLNGHVDVVPGERHQFRPQRQGDRLYGRGAYDMKAAVAVMLLVMSDLKNQRPADLAVDFLIVPDEEASDPGPNCSEQLARAGYRADFVICGEPTDMHVGVHAKGVAVFRLRVPGLAAHSSTPWLGRNAILRAVELLPRIEACPFMHETGVLLGTPTVNLATIEGGEALNCVPANCDATIDVRFLPGQDAETIRNEIAALDPEVEVETIISRSPADLDPTHPCVVGLVEAARQQTSDAMTVGRNGSSDAVAFLEQGIPAVEFGPVGNGHHGPSEWVSTESLVRYRHALVDFIHAQAALSPTQESV